MAKTREEKQAYSRAWYLAHRDEQLARSKARYAEKGEELRERMRERYERNKKSELEKARIREGRCKPGEVAAYVAEFGERCAICGHQPPQERPLVRGEALHADHNHRTGAFRGLLCQAHNLGIGKFKDDPDALEAAARYLRSAV